MKFRTAVLLLLFPFSLSAQRRSPAPAVDVPATIARIREEGLQRSRVMDYESYIADVLGARLTNSRDMQRAQQWLLGELTRLGLTKVAAEPYMEYGVTWDNEYTSLHMLEPDYSPLNGYPIAHTRGTEGRQTLDAVIVELASRDDLARFRGTLRGKAILVTPPATVDLAPLTNGVPRLTDEDLRKLGETVIAPERVVRPTTAPNPNALTADEKVAFYREEGVAVVLQSESGWLGAVRGFSRPGTRDDHWSRAGDLAGPPMVAITPEHYNRMYRILRRNIPVKVEVEVRNAIGDTVIQASNIVAEIPGTDLADQVVMLGAHFDTWHASPNASDNTSGVAPFHDLGMATVSNQSVGSTDHVAFDEVGLPGFQFLQDHTPGTGGHTNLDPVESIQAQDLMKNATIMAAYVWQAAMADAQVPRKSPPPGPR